MDQVIKTLPAILAASGTSEEVVQAACIAAWKHAVGEALNAHAVAVQLQNKTLFVAVEDNIWQKQLAQMRGQLQYRLNTVVGHALVKSIEFRVDSETFRKAGKPDNELNNDSQNDNKFAIPIELLSAAAGIEDPRLRRAFLGAAVSCVKRLEKSET